MTAWKDRDSGGRASGKYNMVVTAVQLCLDKTPLCLKNGFSCVCINTNIRKEAVWMWQHTLEPAEVIRVQGGVFVSGGPHLNVRVQGVPGHC